MKSKQYFNEIIDAYIVPTTDPHRVFPLPVFSLFFSFESIIIRMNMSLIDTNEENSFQNSPDRMVICFVYLFD